MSLGKGLESLIPKKQNIQSPQQDQQTDSNEKPAEGADAFRVTTKKAGGFV